jgi:hypothetical protein
LPPANRIIAEMLFSFFKSITENSAKNLMTSSNLAIVFAPSLFKSLKERDETAMMGKKKKNLKKNFFTQKKKRPL